MTNVEIWTPILKIGSGYAPDLPGMEMANDDIIAAAEQQAKDDRREGDAEYIREKARAMQTMFTSDEGLPEDMVKADGSKAVTRFNVIVDEADIPRIRKHLQAKGTDVIYFEDGDEKDVLMVQMLRACRDDYDGKADDFFNAIPDLNTAGLESQISNLKFQTSNSARKQLAKEVLLQAVARGLSAERAEAIRQRHDLPEASTHG